jgi:iron complex transport system ATP-binding protein
VREILHDVNAEIPSGLFTAMLGQNGSGKTTFFTALSGILPYKGQILLDGISLLSYPPKQRARLLSIVPQMPTRATITVEELLTFGRLPYRTLGQKPTDDDLAAVERALDLFALGPQRRSALDRISGGELRRAYIAMAFVQDTPIIALDEPTAHLDAKNQARILELLRVLRDEHGKTVFAIMHRIADAVQYADQLILMQDGCVRRQGSVHEILRGRDIEQTLGVERYTGEIWGIPSN